jgi:hypothetical protein
MNQVKYTKTATFLFPLLEIPKATFTCRVQVLGGYTKFTNRFINAYAKNTHIDKYEGDYVFLVIKNYRDVSFDTFYSTLTSFPNYVDDYDCRDCFVAIFKPLDKYQKDFELIKEGLYSHVSKEAKALILQNNFWSGKSQETVFQILEKDLELKKAWEQRLSSDIHQVDLGSQEVWSKLDIEQETLSKKVLNTFTSKKELKPIGEF